MAQPLEYHRGSPRRHRWLWGTVLLALILSATFAFPRAKAFKARQERRSAIRHQYTTQLALAEAFLDKNAFSDAAIALFRGEFPTHVEANLFWQSELDSFARQTEQVHHRIEAAYAPIIKMEKEKAEQAQRERELEEFESMRNLVVEHRHNIVNTNPREKTIISLEARAREQLWNGNIHSAQTISEQILELDPLHRFDENFWSRVKSAPPIIRHMPLGGWQNTPPPPE